MTSGEQCIVICLCVRLSYCASTTCNWAACCAVLCCVELRFAAAAAFTACESCHACLLTQRCVVFSDALQGKAGPLQRVEDLCYNDVVLLTTMVVTAIIDGNSSES